MASQELASLFIKLGIDGKQFQRELKKAGGRIDGLDKKTKKTSDGLKSLKKIAGLSFAGWGVSRLTQELVDMSREVDRVTRRIDAAAGGGAKTTRAWAFLREESERLGLNLQDSVKSFSNITAASRLSGVSMEDAEKIFRGVAEAGTAMQMSQDDVNGAMRAVIQIMSKGKAQAEELRGQLGERLPGAFGLAAKAMGVTVEELSKMLDRGEVLAKDLLPNLARVLSKEFGAAAIEASGTVGAEVNRMQTAFFELRKTIVEFGMGDILATLIKQLTGTAKFWIKIITDIQDARDQNIENIEAENKAINAQIAAIEGNAFWNRLLGETVEEQEAKLNDLAQQLNKNNEIRAKWNRSVEISAERVEVLAEQLKEEFNAQESELVQLHDAQKQHDRHHKQWVKQWELETIVAEGRKKNTEEQKKQHKQVMKDISDGLKAMRALDKGWETFGDTMIESNAAQNEFVKIKKEVTKTEEMEAMLDVLFSWDEGFQTMNGTVDDGRTAWQQFVEDVGKGLQRNIKDMTNWQQHGLDIIDSFTQGASSALGKTLFAVIKGDMDDFGEIWSSFWDSMLQTLLNTVAEMAVGWALKVGGGFLANLFRESGEWKIKSDEVPRILHEGEMIVPKEPAEKLRDNFDSFHDMDDRLDPGTSVGSGASAVGGVGPVATEVKTGFKGGLGIGLGQGLELAGSLAQRGAGTNLIGQGLGVGTFIGAASGFLTETVLAAAGATSDIAKAGSTVLPAILSAIGIANPPLAVAAAILGGVGGELIGDALNIRHGEELLDELEEAGLSRKEASEVRDVVMGKSGGLFGLFKPKTEGVPEIGAAEVEFAPPTPLTKEEEEFIRDIPFSPIETFPDITERGDLDDLEAEDFVDAFEAGETDFTGVFDRGTGMEGLPETGPFLGHEGEIVLNPEESAQLRSGGGRGGGGNVTVNLVVDGKVLATTVVNQAKKSPDFGKELGDIINRQ